MSAALTPPDRDRCQAEKPNGSSFMTLGGRPGLERCANRPTVVAAETTPGEDGRRGGMSLCADCLAVFERQMPAGYATFAPVLPRASADEALQALVDHMERLRVATLPLTEPKGPVDMALVGSVGEAQRVEVARYDAWMAERGWTRAEVVGVVREVAARLKGKRPRGRRR